ncbi:hypothetical protein [Polynucleobacter sp.]|uniref:hypothetical protein n=1 Tax=Polynucleobacter sp. TaxID=2029855 RepID=UPI003F69EBEA
MNSPNSVVIASTNDREIISSSPLSSDSVITLGNITNTIIEFVRSGVVRQIDGRFFYASQNDPMVLSTSNIASPNADQQD